ncbi:MAG: DUF2149 domain-containing protein [Methanosarcinales archaeon]
MKKHRKSRKFQNNNEDEDPLSGVANLFDIAMVFAIGLLVVSLIHLNLAEMLTPNSDMTIVKNPGQPDMQVIIKEGKEIKTLNTTDQLVSGQGSKLGGIYQLKDGAMIYVPENMTEKSMK